MQRISLNPRNNWQQKVESAGLTFHTPDAEGMDRPYWDESAAYQFTAAEIDTLEAAGNTLQEMCLAAAQLVIDEKRYAELDIPAEAIPAIEWAWENEPPALYGRFDLSWAGASSGHAPKLLEYNADTPTSLLEAAVIQWTWLEDQGPNLASSHPDQFNSIHEKLIAKWKDLDPYLSKPIYFAGLDNPEDQLTLVYLRREVTRLVVKRGDAIETHSADVVVVSAGAINSAALLLRSASDRHPRGLANGSDMVGRHYMGHVNSVLMAISRCPNPTVFQKTLGLNDFYFGSPEWEYPMGHISFVGKLDADTLRGGAPAIAPGWSLDLMAKHSMDFWLTSEDLPDPDNRVTLDREGNIVLAYRPNNETAHHRLTAKLEQLMKQQRKCGVHGHECHEGLFSRNLFLGQRIPLAGVAHQNGTARFGRDPRESVLDVNCRAHEVDNLYVVDASFFPSSAAVNPALTIMANALRVADHLKGRLGI